MPGYAGGQTERPSYESVSSGQTGHAEVIRVEYDPAIISFDDLLAVFFHVHDHTTRNRQVVIAPKLDKLKKRFRDLLRETE